MSHQITQQHPAVVLRSHYVHMRALLAIAMIAVVGLTITVVLLATRENTTASASPATPVTSSQGASGTSAGGGPIDPGYGYGGHPERGYRGASATAVMPPVDLRTAANPRGVAILPPEKDSRRSSSHEAIAQAAAEHQLKRLP
jgi:hypothetical protein